jgi:DNA-binding IclR family transcriptional regulator
MSIQSLIRAAEILGLYTNARPVLGISEMAQLLGLAQPTVHGLVKTLVLVGFLEREEESRKYRLGHRLYELGTLMTESLEITQKAAPVAQRLAAQTGLYCRVAIRRGDSVLVTTLAYTKEAGTNMHEIGPSVPAYCNALGKAILAHLAPQELDIYLKKNPLIAYTPYTITDKEKLKGELKEYRKKGYFITRQELRLGRSGLAAPIFQRGGILVGAMSISGDPADVLDSRQKVLAAQIIAAAGEVSNSMGYRIVA